MTDLQSQLISLLERLSVVAPQRCELREGYSWTRAGQKLNPPLMEWVVSIGHRRPPTLTEYRQSPKNGWDISPEFILMAVLEEAHARGLTWNVFQSVSLIDSSGIHVMTVSLPRCPSPIETVTAYLECLVLACEQRMGKRSEESIDARDPD